MTNTIFEVNLMATDGRDPKNCTFTGKKFSELDELEKFRKYGTNNSHFEEIGSAFSIVDECSRGGHLNVQEALKKGAQQGGDTTEQKTEVAKSGNLAKRAKEIAAKLMSNAKLSEDENLFIATHEKEITEALSE
jgi:hypothetical protein